MIVKIKIQSVTDLITNSSSEAFVIKATETKEELINILVQMYRMTYGKSFPCSGEGGTFEVCTLDDLTEEHKKSYPVNKRALYTKEVESLQYPISLEDWDNAFYLRIDNGFDELIRLIQNSFKCILYEDGFFRLKGNEVERVKWEDSKSESGEYDDCVCGGIYKNKDGNYVQGESEEYTDDEPYSITHLIR